ncbi:MAG TPA: tRNA (adenosine(37)-N6)-threonylcarbamoyltransferase complex transferase subunit TsaD [Bacteroidia bacterium]|nr:tRNA (adenosine(37)-N6)-threonylcarbamoyltransferase complex transferase subunit TsaD [Bacteroidia bacterium]HNU33463.1 tRNA (adenosine(37)-N6)-threonylcarbamoyltransferase complex transferase subunit TsaD [Bacteroidia bacterium]
MMSERKICILAIESSCDETSAAVSVNNKILSNIIAGQKVHELYGGVVPELASRAHQQNIIPVVDAALKNAGVKKEDLDAVAFTKGPGLIGSLMVGVSFAKSFALSLNIPLVEVNHMQAHVLANFAITEDNAGNNFPQFPFLCLTVSGGHTQIVLVKSFYDMEIIGETQDDAAGEAFDKIAKTLNIPYPGGPVIDKLAQLGDESAFRFPHPHVLGFNFSFSGLKTAVLYFIRDNVKKDEAFVEKNKNDLCASLQKTIVEILLSKLKKAAVQHNINQLAIAGGVSANSLLRKRFAEMCLEKKWKYFIPDFQFCTDNGGMIAVAAYYKYLKGEFAPLDTSPLARMEL